MSDLTNNIIKEGERNNKQKNNPGKYYIPMWTVFGMIAGMISELFLKRLGFICFGIIIGIALGIIINNNKMNIYE